MLANSILTCGFSLGALIFNPVTFAIVSKIEWNYAFVIQAVIITFGVGFTSLSFSDVAELETGDMENCNERTMVIFTNHEEDYVKLSTRIFVGILWFLAISFKSLAYSAPFVFLVIMNYPQFL